MIDQRTRSAGRAWRRYWTKTLSVDLCENADIRKPLKALATRTADVSEVFADAIVSS